MLLFATLAATAQAQQSSAVNYGRVESIGQERIDNSSARTAGALVGGVAGLYSGRNRSRSNRTLRALGGAALGSAATGAATGGTVNAFTVRLLDNSSVRILMDHGNFRLNDCVAVETGDFTNMRRVSEQFCIANVPNDLTNEHRREASECNTAKQAVLNAQSEDEIRLAAIRMDILCQD